MDARYVAHWGRCSTLTFSTWVMLTEVSTKRASVGLFAFGNGVFYFASKNMHRVSLGYWGPFHKKGFASIASMLFHKLILLTN